MQFKLSREKYCIRQMVREFEKEIKMNFTIKSKPFSWNDNFSEVAQEDFSMIQKGLSYCTAQSIGMALAKLELLENQGCEVVEQKQGQWIKDEYSHCYANIYYCSNCLTYERVKTVMGEPAFNYCPNCGAKMVKGTEE